MFDFCEFICQNVLLFVKFRTCILFESNVSCFFFFFIYLDSLDSIFLRWFWFRSWYFDYEHIYAVDNYSFDLNGVCIIDNIPFFLLLILFVVSFYVWQNGFCLESSLWMHLCERNVICVIYIYMVFGFFRPLFHFFFFHWNFTVSIFRSWKWKFRTFCKIFLHWFWNTHLEINARLIFSNLLGRDSCFFSSYSLSLSPAHIILVSFGYSKWLRWIIMYI